MPPFWPYYGSKWRLARRLGPPRHDLVVEPFAGGAGYSTFWEPRQVVLHEVDEIVYGVWRYLQQASTKDIMSLPVQIDHVDEMRGCSQEAKWLVGFWLNPGCAKPSLRRSNWARRAIAGDPDTARVNVWTERNRQRLARQVERIRHWRIYQSSWENARNTEAHWHIDPPYSVQAGRSYRHDQINFARLADWCIGRKGFVQVCEAKGADWLDFKEFATIRGGQGKGRKSHSIEAVYQSGTEKWSLF